MGIFKRKKKWGNFSGNINIHSDLKKSDIPKIIAEKNIHSLQLFQFPNPKRQTWETLNEFFSKYPDIGLRVLWYECQDLSFYKLIPNIRKFTIATYNIKDYSILKTNTKLKHFGIEETKSKAVDISFINKFTELESLYVDGMKKGLENVKHLSNLQTLTFRGVKLDNLDFLNELTKLQELNLLYGSYKDLDAVSKLNGLKELELSRVRQIPDYHFLRNLVNLEKLCFEGMSEMSILPDLSGLKSLKRIQVDNNSRLNDISSISQIPNLEEFLLFFPENFKASVRKKLTEQAYQIVMESKTIKSTSIWLRVNNEQRENLRKKGVEFWNYSKEAEDLVSKK
ncbi:MAG: hypothetical protein ACX93I_14940 [Winogradskyella sp.]